MASKWIQSATRKMEKKGTKGSLTRAAKRAGYDSATSFAHHIEAHPDDYSAKTRKRASFALNVNQ